MFASRIRAAALSIAAGLSLSACAYGDPYSGVSIGFGTGYSTGYGYGYGYDDYYDPWYDDYYYRPVGWGRRYSPAYGWNDGFYYPGAGYYVYDRYRRPFRWNDHQRRYWEGRRSALRPQLRQHFRQENRQFRQHHRDERRALRQGQMTREQFRQHRREEERAFREHRRSHRRGDN